MSTEPKNTPNIREIIPLMATPFREGEIPTITSSAISEKAGTVIDGAYSMNYRLPGGDYLRLFANHNQKQIQLFLFTRDPNKIAQLPGPRPSSLVANSIAQLNRYLIRSANYAQPRSKAQLAKAKKINKGIDALIQLLKPERQLQAHDWTGQEKLRLKVLNIIEQCRDKNRLLANYPLVSEGELGNILYEARQAAQQYEFNRVFPVSRLDQLDFSKGGVALDEEEQPPHFVWDSDVHIGQDEAAINDALRVITQQYNLAPSEALSNIPANRFKQVESFLHKLWYDGRDWINALKNPQPPSPDIQITEKFDVSASTLKPYYHFAGIPQQPYASISDMLAIIPNRAAEGHPVSSVEQGIRLLNQASDGHWVWLEEEPIVLIKIDGKLLRIHYAIDENDRFFPLPTGQDLYEISQIAKRHLYWPERFQLRFKTFFSRIPTVFVNFFISLKYFITHDLYDDYAHYIHHDHLPPPEPAALNNAHPAFHPIEKMLEEQGLIAEGETLTDFITRALRDSPHVMAISEHPPSPPAYDNPIHRILGVTRHIGSYFVDASEKNPIVGTLALAAYLYGAGAIIAPKMLTALLTKLHLKGLIAGIEPTKHLGAWMSHGTMSEAISAACTYWQGIIIGGDPDKFFINAISVLREDPAEVAIIIALAISLGYGLCEGIPALQKEMGKFPLPNYAALGAKGGAAIYDTVMHPGEDWFIGSIKWLLKKGLTVSKIVLGPCIEWYFYKGGFVNGGKKSLALILSGLKQSLAAMLDLVLSIATIPLLEVSAMFIHVPLKGITNLLSKTLNLLGNWQPIGETLIAFATRDSNNVLPDFRPSVLYGFSSPPFRDTTQKPLSSGFYNVLLFILWPPFQLLKNAILLPLIDFSSLVLRAVIAVIDPLSRGIGFVLGTCLYGAGFVTDYTVGYLFRGTALAITHVSNWLDRGIRQTRQYALGVIQVLRRGLYHWAFGNEEQPLHQVQTATDYFVENPKRWEQVRNDNQPSFINPLMAASEQECSYFQPMFIMPPSKADYYPIYSELNRIEV